MVEFRADGMEKCCIACSFFVWPFVKVCLCFFLWVLSFASSVVKPACHVVREFWTGWWIILVILLAKNPWDLTELKHVLSIFLPGLQLFAYFDLFLFVCVCVLTPIFSLWLRSPLGTKQVCHRHRVCPMAVSSLWCFPQAGEQGSVPALHLWQGCVLLAFHRWKPILCPLFWTQETWFGFFPLRGDLSKPSMYLNSKMVIIFLHWSGWSAFRFFFSYIHSQ